MRNGTYRAFLLLLIVGIALTLMQLLPAANVAGYEVKPVKMLADVMPEETVELDMPELPPSPSAPKKEKPKRPVPKGMVLIEDYGTESGHGMEPFYAALNARDSLGRPVRIAYFGDSFIEGDILTADLRSLLQQRFGGCGAGFIDISSSFIALRPTVRHSAEGFTDHNLMDKESCDLSRITLTGRYAVPSGAARVTYSGVKSPEHLEAFDKATLFLSSPDPQTVEVTTENGTISHTTMGTGDVEAVSTAGRSRRVAFSLPAATEATTCFGVAMEGKEGVVLDNFSMRGSSGVPLATVPQRHLRQLSRLRPYDLIVLQFGLNVASKSQLKYGGYVHQMKRVVKHFKEAFPEAGILVVSIGDREDKMDGELQTMPGVKALVKYQQLLAAEEGVAFWNLYEAMGGEGAMVRMANAKPAEAGKDYTHINRRGGRRIAGIFYKTLLFGYKENGGK